MVFSNADPLMGGDLMNSSSISIILTRNLPGPLGWPEIAWRQGHQFRSLGQVTEWPLNWCRIKKGCLGHRQFIGHWSRASGHILVFNLGWRFKSSHTSLMLSVYLHVLHCFDISSINNIQVLTLIHNFLWCFKTYSMQIVFAVCIDLALVSWSSLSLGLHSITMTTYGEGI